MKVYVMYDGLMEKVICVHEDPGMTCPKCSALGDNHGYGIEESEQEVVRSKRSIREEKLKDIGL